MKKWTVSFISLVFLTGCTASDQIDRGMSLRSDILRSSGGFEAVITADYGDKSQSFTLDCTFDAFGDLDFEVVEPEEISGISGSIQDSAGAIKFDDTVLYFDLLTDEQLSPVSTPWIFLKALRSGYLTSAGNEGEYLRLSIDDSYEEDALHLDIWLNAGNIPVSAEIIYEERRILSMEIGNFRFM